MFFLQWQSDGFGTLSTLLQTGTSGWIQACVSWHLGLSSNRRQTVWLVLAAFLDPFHCTFPFFTFEGLVRRKKVNIKDTVYTLCSKVRWEIIMAFELMTWEPSFDDLSISSLEEATCLKERRLHKEGKTGKRKFGKGCSRKLWENNK